MTKFISFSTNDAYSPALLSTANIVSMQVDGLYLCITLSGGEEFNVECSSEEAAESLFLYVESSLGSDVTKFDVP